MQTEIERKFLIKSNTYKKEASRHYDIKQGFLNRDKYRTVRIRIKANQGFITVKGLSSKDGLSRLEWEKEISPKDAQGLLKICEGHIIHKTRYEIKIDNHLFEVDEFHGHHQGLVIAEIELQDKNESFQKPDWLGEEVTGQLKYYNSQL